MAAELKSVSTRLERAAKIDRLGELDRQIQEFAPVADEHKRLKEEVEGWYDSMPAGEPVVEEGQLYTLQLTARSKERTITNPQKAFNLLRKNAGAEAVLALITIPLGAGIDKFIPASLHKTFLVEELSGSRRMKLVPKASPAPARKAA